jgi:hypothetical protein
MEWPLSVCGAARALCQFASRVFLRFVLGTALLRYTRQIAIACAVGDGNDVCTKFNLGNDYN